MTMEDVNAIDKEELEMEPEAAAAKYLHILGHHKLNNLLGTACQDTVQTIRDMLTEEAGVGHVDDSDKALEKLNKEPFI